MYIIHFPSPINQSDSQGCIEEKELHYAQRKSPL
jgi:hypothetical protein